jgi:hypothetical protein
MAVERAVVVAKGMNRHEKHGGTTRRGWWWHEFAATTVARCGRVEEMFNHDGFM